MRLGGPRGWPRAGCALTAGGVGLWLLAYLWLPWAANHFNVALPPVQGLPHVVIYHGRGYGAADCSAEPASTCRGLHPCRTQAALIAAGLWPLAEAGTVPAVGGPAPPILVQNPGQFPFVVFVPNGPDCYVGFGLQGGP